MNPDARGMSPIPRGAHAYVDETKARGFIMVAACLAPAEVTLARRALRSLVPSGRPRLHFKKLSDPQRHRTLKVIRSLGVTVVVVRSRHPNQAHARSTAWRMVLLQLRDAEAGRVVIERDDSSQHSDEHVARAVWPDGPVIHLSASEEPLLWASDAVAWCLQRGGHWPAEVRPLIASETVINDTSPARRP